ncbi:glycosyltransferase [Rubrobacter taiwanensis]|jgi:dolichol-phosphate mannosyltransferase|uniref:Glycosyltransferase n=1 Tax=Rubrobacter taiwanensis TaxID=185139 RepID=A0A4R1BDH1_9ACTN|nr:glycosyltransferase [Rubrobacter taiwanensis]TCJ15129.1 glycosyltransferase [Rubrobacter taiwanensis]
MKPAHQGSTRPLLTLVIPTRNEAGNVPELAERLSGALSGLDYRIVFIDDSSDETPEVIEELRRRDPRIRLIHRDEAEQRGGLSTAVIAGMELAESEYTCVMDADLQHPPEKVGEMLKVAQSSGADVVVASRYARGGGYAGLASPARRIISRGSRLLAKLVFSEARKTTDPLTGFFLVRTRAISGLQFRPTGFKVLLEILVCAPDLKVREIPFRFQPRRSGTSKATLRQGLEYLSHILSLFWYVPSAGRFWKFAMVGSSGVVVNMAVLISLVELAGADKTVAWMLAVGASIMSNFLLNNAFTWRDVRNASRIHFLMRGALSYPVAILALGANFAVYYPLKDAGHLFPTTMADYAYIPAALLGILAATAVNFTLNSQLVFRQSKPGTIPPDTPPAEIARKIQNELKADRVNVIGVPDMNVLARSGVPHRTDSDLDRSVIELVIKTRQPSLVVTGPRRLPQARTNARWANSLAVPIVSEEEVVGVIYATRTSSEPFTEEDLHWLTARTAAAGPVFEPRKIAPEVRRG